MAESARNKGDGIIEDTAGKQAQPVRRVASTLLWTAAIVTLAAGAGLFWFSGWRAPIAEGDTAAASGDWARALERYAAAEARFNDWPLAQRLFPATYRATLANQLTAHYRLGSLDAVLEKADTIPPSAASHFWAGSALFEKSKAEENTDARLGFLGRATDEFKAALELRPDDWDFIYNYELARRLFDELRKKPKTPPKQLLELLRPQPKEGNKPVKRVG
jgi:tetratricopeptide (TPR) repeat protein